MPGKLTLQLDQLAVESFSTSAAQAEKGTVFGEQCTCHTACTCPGCPTCDASCNGTCGATCDASCNTCEYSCYYTDCGCGAETCQQTNCGNYFCCL